MLNKKEREKVLALYFGTAKNYTIKCLQNFAGKDVSEFWEGGENALQILLLNLKLEKEVLDIQNYLYKLELQGRQAVTWGTPTEFNLFIDTLYHLTYIDYKKEVL